MTTGPAAGGPDPEPGGRDVSADWVTLEDLHRDPFPIYAQLRRDNPVPFVRAADRYLVTRYEDVRRVDNDPDTFTANESPSLMKRAMGHSMLRKDNPVHARERETYGGVMKPRAVNGTWTTMFEDVFEECFQHYVDAGPGADLVSEFAAPFASENLRLLMGFQNATHHDMLRWSQTLINGTGNYADDPEVWELAEASFAEVDQALDEMTVHYRSQPDETLISHIVNVGRDVSVEATRANIKMSIGGGINEPRDALTTAVWALLDNPDQLAAATESNGLWRDVFEESVRWVAPIGMYPRQTTREVELAGTLLPAGARVGVCALSANRDETVFENADRFDIFRPKQPHLAFGGGDHFCAGAWVARAQVAQIALPRLFSRLKGLSLVEDNPPVAAGWVFRGMTALPLTWKEVA